MSRFFELAAERYSVRSFSPRAIEPDILRQVLEAGRIAPTAHNSQPQRIKIISDPADLVKVDECTPCRYGAPVVLLICYDQTVCYIRQYDDAKSGEVDASIVTTYLMLAAQDYGLGSCWIMRFDPTKAVELFALPREIVPVAMLALGYPSETAAPSARHNDRLPLEKTLFT